MKHSATDHSKETETSAVRQEESSSQVNGLTLSPPSYGIHLADTPSPIIVQAKKNDLSIKKDPYEKEADRMADLAVRKQTVPSAAPASPPSNGKNHTLQAKEQNGNSNSRPAGKSSTLSNKSGNGSPMDSDVQAQMEAVFGADFGNVRVHTDSGAAQMSQQINAKAFTYGSDIYFNEGMYAPNTHSGKKLLAHELTHTIQQGAAQSHQSATLTTLPSIQADTFDDIIGFFRKYANDIPGYRLFSVIIQYDLFAAEKVEWTAENFLDGVISLAPGGHQLFLALKENKILEKTFEWFKGVIKDLNLSLDRIKGIFEKAYDQVDLSDAAFDVAGSLFSGDTPKVIEDLIKDFQRLYDDVIAFAKKAVKEVFKYLKEALVIPLAKMARETKGYELLTKVLGKDPITGEEVTATTAEILEDFLLLLGKEQELKMMKERGTLQETADWLDVQLKTFLALLDQLKGAFTEVWNNFKLEDWIADPWAQLKAVIAKFKDPVINFVKFGADIALKVLQFIKDSLLSWMGTYLKENLRGFHLLTVILEKDPITGQAVERTGENLILGFLSLILPDERIQEIKETGAIQQTIDWIMTKIEELGMSWQDILKLFKDLWDSFTIEDILKPVEAFIRIKNKFQEPVLKVLTFIKDVVLKVVEVILQIMQFPVDVVQSIIAKAMQAYEDIKRDPVQFFLNLLDAVKLGFQQFFDKIGEHLLGGLKAWLFKQLEKAGITPPEDFSLESVLKLVMEVLGVTKDKIFAKIEKKIGKEKMDQIRAFADKLVGIWNFVTDIIEGGPAAIWEKIQEKLSGLWDAVLGFIQDWIMEKIISKVTAKLLSMLDPTGIMAVVNSVMALYDSIQSAIEYFREMLEIVNTFVSGVADVAKGSLATAASFLENALAQGVPVAIGYLANLIGLDDLAGKLHEILAKVRLKVDEALDWLIDKAIAMGSGLLEMGKAAVEKFKDWWKGKKEFIAQNGEKHELYFTGSGSQAVLMVASTNPLKLDKFFKEKKKEAKQGGVPFKVSDVEDAENYYKNNVQKIQKELIKNDKQATSSQKKSKGVDDNKEKVADLEKAISTLSEKLKKLYGGTVEDYPPPILPVMADNKKASSFTAQYLVKGEKYKVKTGTESGKHTGNLDGWPQLQGAHLTKGSKWVRMHLLPHKLGGDAVDSNLTPASGPKSNIPFSSAVEQPAIKAAVEGKPKKNKPIWYKFEIEYHDGGSSPFPSFLKAEWGFYKHENGKFEEDKVEGFKKQNPEKPKFTPLMPNLNDPDVTPGEIAVASGVDRSFVKLLLRVRSENGKSLGTSSDSVELKMEKKYVDIDENGNRQYRFGVKDFDDKLMLVINAIDDDKIVLK